ncbi:MAG: hypothetical protein OXQ92_06955 [Boseongicola sp.]|nr:hypothetical protein [Boseongicola sp.]
MKKTLMTASALAIGASVANAGGIDRSGQYIGQIFNDTGESGTSISLSFGSIMPEANRVGGGETNPLQDYNSVGFVLNQKINDKVTLSLLVDEPFGADVRYVDSTFAGGFATISTTGVTALARYQVNENVSVYGGPRAMTGEGEIASSPGLLQASSDYDFGYVVGAAYEKPEIALRVALTYSSEIANTYSGTENFAPIADFDVDFPESYNLEFQTGVAEDTLLFGSVRYVAWDGFNLTANGNVYASFSGNTITYSLGVGRRFNEKLSGAITLGYEKQGGETTTPLAPTTGRKSIGVGATYAISDTVSVTGGITYAELGDQTLAGTGGTIGWADNGLVAGGVRLNIKF